VPAAGENLTTVIVNNQKFVVPESPENNFVLSSPARCEALKSINHCSAGSKNCAALLKELEDCMAHGSPTTDLRSSPQREAQERARQEAAAKAAEAERQRLAREAAAKRVAEEQAQRQAEERARQEAAAKAAEAEQQRTAREAELKRQKSDTEAQCSDPNTLYIPIPCLPKTNVPFEQDGRIAFNISKKAEFCNTLRDLVKANGYRCDTISSIISFFLSPGYTLNCNDYRYEYEIADEGGRWIVTVK
jgi:flagellar biosynthesis GTPase FlhF